GSMVVWAPLASADVAAPAGAQAPGGEELFQSFCAVCHANPVEDDIPTAAGMLELDPNGMAASLTDGNMRLQGQLLTPAQHVVVAEYLTGRPVRERSAQFTTGLCTERPPWPD